jgi:ATP-dependent helicase/nuclease subunit A
MSSQTQKPAPPDQAERIRALDPSRSILVQAPAGSGKTDLLTRRFLRLLAEVDEPSQVVAITFTIAAAAEMRHRILGELEKAAAGDGLERNTNASSIKEDFDMGLSGLPPIGQKRPMDGAQFDSPPVGEADGRLTPDSDEFSMQNLALRALEHSRRRDWNLLDLPAQLRISTIDSFCRELALQQPLLSSLGGGIDIAEQPDELYRRAARQTLERIGQERNDQADQLLSDAIEALLLWRDNNWQEMEGLLVEMLAKRDRWMHDFVLSAKQDRDPDWSELRDRLERPFANAVREALTEVALLLNQVPGACEEALALARFACQQADNPFLRELAELADFPSPPFRTADDIEEARQAYANLAELLLIGAGTFRKKVDKNLGFPADRKSEKAQMLALIARLDGVPGLASALDAVRNLPPCRYTEEDWKIVRACFTLLRHAAAELQVVFAEAAAVDFIEVAQIAQSALRGPDDLPTGAAFAVADGIRHLLVDEFQDTSRRQHQLLASLIAAWPERNGCTCFLVGDPMQSIYFFRDADAELFPRVKNLGLEIPEADPLLFDFVPLKANFRSAPSLVDRLNEVFLRVFAVNDGSGISFSSSQPVREVEASRSADFKLHLNFSPQTAYNKTTNAAGLREMEQAHNAQTQQIVALIQSHLQPMERARGKACGNSDDSKYRIAVLGRTRTALAPIAAALREAAIPFRALDLERLKDQPEVLDALALAHALLNPQDRVAWLGVLRAPWCGLSLEDLHLLTSADNPNLIARPVPDVLAERFHLLSDPGREAASRVLNEFASAQAARAGQSAAMPGTWLEQIWLRLGGADCVDATARANVDLLWSCLDSLPAGVQDLLGSNLSAALDKLTALPDPLVSSDFGVQLMTIHKSKGLEFKVVIVPDLQAGAGNSSHRLLAWLERGLAGPHEIGSNRAGLNRAGLNSSGEITEFLVAPLQTKGADHGKSKAWVDRVYRERESQEMRRILYVAATRAREELHLFARPNYKVEADGSFALVEPTNSLLATAWPALQEEVRAHFEGWKTVRTSYAAAEEQVIESIAAAGDGNLFAMLTPTSPTPVKPTLVRCLPPHYRPSAASFLSFSGKTAGDGESQAAHSSSELGSSSLYSRHEGGLLARALGNAVHAFLEELSRLRTELDWEAARAGLRKLEPRIAASIRASGVDRRKSSSIAAEALQLAVNASHSPEGQWILSPHTGSGSEVRWAGMVSGGLRTVRVDRVFRAGLEPVSEGEQAWWIIDYKTAYADDDPAATLPALRKLFAPQLEAYGQMLRNLHGPGATLRAGLFYPRMLLLDWWEL